MVTNKILSIKQHTNAQQTTDQMDEQSAFWTFDILNICSVERHHAFDKLKDVSLFLCYYTYFGTTINPDNDRANYSVKGYVQFKEPITLSWLNIIFDKYAHGLHLTSSENRPDLVMAILTAKYAIEVHHHGVPNFGVDFDSPKSTIPKTGTQLFKKTCKKLSPVVKVFGKRVAEAAAVAVVVKIGLLLNVDSDLL